MGGVQRRRFVQGSVVAAATCGVINARASKLSPGVLIRVEAGDTTVCGFLAMLEGKTYVVTNTSLVSGHERLAFKTLSGKELKPKKIELSMTRNIARFEVDSSMALEIAAEVSEGEEVAVVDFSPMGSAYAKLTGPVAKVYEGRFRPEVLFSRELSGSPVLSAEGKACGVAAVIDFYKLSNLEWASAAMRTVYQLDGDQWFSPSWKKYNASYGQSLRQIDEFRNDIYKLMQMWVRRPKAKMEVENEKELGFEVQRWIKQHNGMVTKLERAKKSKKKGGDPYAPVRKDFSDSCKALVSISTSKAKSLEFLTQQDKITPFLKNEFMWRSRELNKFAAYIRGYEKSMERFQW